MRGMLINPETGDLLVQNGRIQIGITDDQIAYSVLLANRGEFKEFPLLGAEIVKLTNGIKEPLWEMDVKDMLQACGVPVSKVTVDGNRIKVE